MNYKRNCPSCGKEIFHATSHILNQSIKGGRVCKSCAKRSTKNHNYGKKFSYDSDYNVVIEFDGKYHKKPSQKRKDLIRQSKIINNLHPKKFWRYNSVDKTITNVVED